MTYEVGSKVFVIMLRNGEQWGIPVAAILRNAAEYYASRDDIESGGVDSEMQDILENWTDADVDDWAHGNMDWDDVKDLAIKLNNGPPLTEDDFRDAWNDETEIVIIGDILR